MLCMPLKILDVTELSLIKEKIMKIVIFIVSSMILMSACSSKKESLSEYEYQRSNAASEKAFDKLDRE